MTTPAADPLTARASLWVLVVVNLLPLVGVAWFGWRTFDVVFVYWLENVVIGVVNVLKIVTCRPDPALLDVAELMSHRVKNALPHEKLAPPTADEVEATRQELVRSAPILGALKWVLAPFFVVHYGMFCFVHGVFVCALLGGDAAAGLDADKPLAVGWATLQSRGTQFTIAALVASHLYSYAVNYLGGGEFRRTFPPTLMMQPYGRVVLLHVAIIFGGMLTLWLGSPVWLLTLLVVGKTGLDAVLHVREHRA
jgi:hypothetical protein